MLAKLLQHKNTPAEEVKVAESPEGNSKKPLLFTLDVDETESTDLTNDTIKDTAKVPEVVVPEVVG